MNQKKREIQNLILMLTSAILIAFALVAWLLYVYSSSKSVNKAPSTLTIYIQPEDNREPFQLLKSDL